MIESIDDLIIFLKHFHRDILTDPSLPPEQIPTDLPEGLAKIYRELGKLVNIRRTGPFDCQDRLIPVGHLERIDGTIEFCWENQGCWSVRCPANRKNPPVYSNYRSWDGWNSEEDFVVVCDSLDRFLITLCLQEASCGSRNFVMVEGVDNILDIIIEKEKFQPLWLNGQYVYRDELQDFYVSEDRDILINKSYGWIGSQSRPLMDIFDPNADPKVKVNMFGVDLPRRYWTNFSNWQPEWLLDEQTPSLRRILIEQLGHEEICHKLGITSIDA